jgi:hypothetical protein
MFSSLHRPSSCMSCIASLDIRPFFGQFLGLQPHPLVIGPELPHRFPFTSTLRPLTTFYPPMATRPYTLPSTSSYQSISLSKTIVKLAPFSSPPPGSCMRHPYSSNGVRTPVMPAQAPGPDFEMLSEIPEGGGGS